MAQPEAGTASSLRLRWAAAAVCLVLVAVLGSESARRHAASEDSRATMAATAADEAGAHGKMFSMQEIRARAAASARVVHKASDKHEADDEGINAVKDAALVKPNARLVHLLDKKAAVYQKAGSGQLKAAQRRQEAAAQDKLAAQGDLTKASAMRKKALADKVHSQQAKQAFRNAELPTLQADKDMKAADRAYRHDMLDMATIYPKIGEDKASGRPVPAALEQELKNVTARLKADQAQKKKYGQMLASDARASASSNSFEENIGKDPENLRAEQSEYGLHEGVEDAVKNAQHKMADATERMTKGKQEEVVAKRVLGIADCITKHAKTYSYDENKVEHVERVYQRVLDDCDA